MTEMQWTERSAVVAYILEEADRYDIGSGIVSILEILAMNVSTGEHVASAQHGELDDWLASAPVKRVLASSRTAENSTSQIRISNEQILAGPNISKSDVGPFRVTESEQASEPCASCGGFCPGGDCASREHEPTCADIEVLKCSRCGSCLPEDEAYCEDCANNDD